jgi:hypothetical protein
MSQLILTRGVSYRRNLLKKYINEFHVGPVFLVGSLVLFVALVTVITLMFSARQVTKGYVLNSLEAQNQELVKESEKIDMQISKVRSLNFIEDSTKVSTMIIPGQIAFVSGDSAIASR